MASWSEIEREATELAEAVRGRFEAHLHHVLATLRADGSPRVSGTEVRFAEGEVWMGMMPDSLKGRDLARDPRYALHAATVDVELGEGDARLAGRAELVTDPERVARGARAYGRDDGDLGGDLARLDVEEVVLVRVQGELLVLDAWHEGRGVTRHERR